MEVSLKLGDEDSFCNSKIIRFSPCEVYKQVDFEVKISEQPDATKEVYNINHKCNNVKQCSDNNIAKTSDSCEDIIFILILFLVLKIINHMS